MSTVLTRPVRWLAALTVGLVLAVLTVPAPALAADFVPIDGDGSSWAEPAIDQWSRDVHNQGIRINFSGDGSAAGRQHYILNQADFAASDIALITPQNPDPFGLGTEQSRWAYSYIPIVAGGTSLLYNLVVAGKKITNLRLSGDTVAKIFTGQITNWSDARITRDYGAQLPSQKITVVTRSDGSGASYMFSQYLDKQFHSQWQSFCSRAGGAPPCGPTEFYPKVAGGIQRNGSDQVANYIASSSIGEGSIGYDEYAYAMENNIPVAKLLNSAGYYTAPTQYTVAIALQAAKINEDPNSPTFLMQDLSDVYGYSDARTYPISSYSYLIVPRTSRPLTDGPPTRFNDAKGATLSTWLNYVMCGAQQKAGQLGYSPLPKNLVVGGFQQVAFIPGHVPIPDTNQLNGCPNPTYHDGVNHLIKDAPMPSPCDYKTAPLNCVVVAGKATQTNGASGGGGGGASGGAGGSGGAGSGTGGAGGAGTTGGPGAGPGGTVQIDPDTGLPVGTGSGATDGTVLAASVPLGSRTGQNWLISVLTALDILAAVAVPGAIGVWLNRRRRRSNA